MDVAAARRIAELCVTRNGDLVIEVGPAGPLTLALLAAGARVIAVEIDTELVGVLRGRADLGEAAFLEADALAFDFEQAARGSPWCAGGNLPYNRDAAHSALGAIARSRRSASS